MNRVVRVLSVSLSGLSGSKITVEAGVSRQIPGLGIVGLPDAALSEAKQRVRHAASSVGMSLTDRYVLINLQPADLPKHGSGFDLAIAVAALGALQKVSIKEDASIAHIGELGLDGKVKRPRALLATVAAAKKLGFRTLIIGQEGVEEAKLVPGITVIGVETLADAVAWHENREAGWEQTQTPSKTPHKHFVSPKETVDISEIMGQQRAVGALELAAIGRHHLHMHGPPGAGKTMLAKRLPGILPDLETEEAILASSVKTLASHKPLEYLAFRPPFVAPHHTASAPAIIGSAQGGMVHPGAISLASFGVLFLDEAQEYPTAVLDALRQPLETGTIAIHRAKLKIELPASVQLVLASNPCPCGNGGSPKTVNLCTCSPIQLRRYQNKLSGPLQDRIDLSVFVDRVASVEQQSEHTELSSAVLKKRVTKAREATAARLRNTPWKLNSEVPGSYLRSKHLNPGRNATLLLDRALKDGRITLRGYDRTLRVAWSICDRDGKTVLDRDAIFEALMLRNSRF